MSHKIVDAQKEDRFGGGIRQIHDAAQDSLPCGPNAQTSSKPGACLAAGGEPKGRDVLTVSDLQVAHWMTFKEDQRLEWQKTVWSNSVRLMHRLPRRMSLSR